MPRYKLAIHILVIFSVFIFVPVLAAPVAIQEVREACADVVDGGEDMIIVSGKRSEEGQDRLTQASQGQGSTSVQLSTQGSSSTSDYASGVHQETINPTRLPDEMQRPPYARGGTELPWYSSDGTERHLIFSGRSGAQQVQPGTTSKLQPAISMRVPMQTLSNDIGGDWLPDNQRRPPPSESSGEIAALPPSEQEGPLKPQSFLSKVSSKSKGFFRKIGKMSKSLISEMVDNPRLQIY